MRGLFSKRHGRLLGFAVLAGVVGFVITGLVAAGTPNGKYWVEGAQPTVYEDGHASCVPYSPEREDVSVCGPVPDGWTPEPLAYYDKSICTQAVQWLDDQRSAQDAAGLSEADINEEYPQENSGTCLVQETGPGHVWQVTFKIAANPDANVHVPYDPEGKVEWAAHP